MTFLPFPCLCFLFHHRNSYLDRIYTNVVQVFCFFLEQMHAVFLIGKQLEPTVDLSNTSSMSCSHMVHPIHRASGGFKVQYTTHWPDVHHDQPDGAINIRGKRRWCCSFYKTLELQILFVSMPGPSKCLIFVARFATSSWHMNAV